jgi:ribonuclease E
MSPFLRRLAGLFGRPAEQPAASSSTPSSQSRGRRGGRGRGRGSAPPPPTDERPASRGTGAPDSRYSANGSGGSNGSSYDRRRPRRRDLDQPLPEDIAFRPPAEGGDRSILPSRRRPPPGLRATKRVLLAGQRFVPRGQTADEEPDVTDVRDTLPPAQSPPPAGESPEPGKRRRRGRRGGRGRRRGGDGGAADATPHDEA